MKKREKRELTLMAEIHIPYEAYDTEAKNRKVVKQCIDWIQDYFRMEEGGTYIPLYIEKADKLSCIEDRTGKTKVRVWEVR